jgi:hypothetical protein
MVQGYLKDIFRMRQVSGGGDARELTKWQGAAQRHRQGLCRGPNSVCLTAASRIRRVVTSHHTSRKS